LRQAIVSLRLAMLVLLVVTDSIERTSFLFSPQTQHTFVDLVGVKLIELMFTTSSQLFEYFSRLFTPKFNIYAKTF
jgi:hypothetical protein